MSRRFARCSMVMVAIGLLSSQGWAAVPNDVKQEMAAAVDAVRPALIRIHIVSADYRQGREFKSESAGSGVIVSPEGYAVTNHHVAGHAERLVCTLADRREVEAKLIGTDPLADIAVIKLISPDGKPFPTAEWGDSSKLEVGDRVFAMGCPYSLSQSVTMGIVSNTEMVMPDWMGSGELTLEGEDVGSLVRWIGHDALIRSGNSGGPLVDRAGKVVGVNEISFGLSGAIPANLAKEVAAQLIEHGKVTRSWLGLEVQPLLKSSIMDRGILVSGVMDDSPAQRAGFASGDVILTLDGKGTTARFREQVPIFNQFVADLPVGKTVVADVLRDGKEITISVTTAERQKAEDQEHELKPWGICASNITYLMQKEMERANQDGVVITGVLPSGPAGSAKPPLREDDVIVEVNGEAIKDVAGLRAITHTLIEGKDEPVPALVSFDRKQTHLATVVKVGEKEQARPGAEISKAWLPIGLQVLTRDLAEALGATGKTGVRVTQVYAGMSAEKAGLRVGDLIVTLDGETIPADQVGDEEVLPSLIRQYEIGAEVKLGIIRDGEPMEIAVTLEANPKLPRDYRRHTDEEFGFTVRDIAFVDRAEGGIKQDQSGVYVESVVEGSWAALGQLHSGDVIAQIDGQNVGNLDDLKSVMQAVADKKPKAVVLKVQRGIHTLFVEIEPDWSETDS